VANLRLVVYVIDPELDAVLDALGLDDGEVSSPAKPTAPPLHKSIAPSPLAVSKSMNERRPACPLCGDPTGLATICKNWTFGL
jgi:hypothetical protein